MAIDRPVFKKGEVHKVKCQKTGELTLIINCLDGCSQFKGYDHKNKIVKCEQR